MSIRNTLVLSAISLSAACASTTMAQVYVDTPGPNNLDDIAEGSDIQVGTSATDLAPGVSATNAVIRTWVRLYSWSDSVVTLNNAIFTGEDLQAHNSSRINYIGGVNPNLSLISYDSAVISVTGGTIGFLASGAIEFGAGGSAVMSGGTLTQLVGCTAGFVSITGGTFLPPTLTGEDYSFFSVIPGIAGVSGINFSGTGLTALYQGIDPNYGSNRWLLGGTLANGGSLNGLYLVDIGNTDSSVITNYSGLTIIPAPGALALLGAAGLVGGRRRRS